MGVPDLQRPRRHRPDAPDLGHGRHYRGRSGQSRGACSTGDEPASVRVAGHRDGPAVGLAATGERGDVVVDQPRNLADPDRHGIRWDGHHHGDGHADQGRVGHGRWRSGNLRRSGHSVRRGQPNAATDCSYTWTQAGSYQATATVYWSVAWTAVGAPGGGDLGVQAGPAAQVPVTVTESQAINTSSGGN